MTCERYEGDLALHVEGDLEASAAVRCEAPRGLRPLPDVSPRASAQPEGCEGARRGSGSRGGSPARTLAGRRRNQPPVAAPRGVQPGVGLGSRSERGPPGGGRRRDLATASRLARTTCETARGSTVGSCPRTRDASDRLDQ